MNQTKQNILVVTILFLSLLTTVMLGYAITPSNDSGAAEPPAIKTNFKAAKQPQKSQMTLHLLLPKLVK
ncbi:hypothetical protein [Marinicella meishanensis]|uniref:hypothetical protein n=1 Tax=Marinicella meishanensis TaxID=2873263 RepID=UPI001CBD0972|nr:hypothetical protein [Marinicella sp. NBU2979]